jgi:excisionase family DNA binding protein
MEPVLTIDEVAQSLRVHPRTIHRLIAAWKLPAFKAGGDWRIKESALDAYIESTSNVPTAKPKKKPAKKAVKKTAKKGGPKRRKK